MKENYKLEKELLFKNNIKDITSISLDTDFVLDGLKIKGNFFINGDYRIHEVSINRESFNFKIPFEHDIKDDIDHESIKVDINNFVYDYSKDELMVKIDYEITGSRKDVLLFDDEKSLDEFLKDKEVDVIDDRIETIKQNLENDETSNRGASDCLPDVTLENEILKNESTNEEEQKEETKEEIRNEEDKQKNEVDKKELEKDIIEEKDKILENDEIRNENNETTFEKEKKLTDEVINSVGDKENFIMYKIHKITETDTIENIVMKYHTTLDELKEFNDLSDLKINDKIIIPKYE